MSDVIKVFVFLLETATVLGLVGVCLLKSFGQ